MCSIPFLLRNCKVLCCICGGKNIESNTRKIRTHIHWNNKIHSTSTTWTFVIADITNPLLGLDFLKFGLIVDCSNKTIYDPTTTQRKSLKISVSSVNLVVNEMELPSFVRNMIRKPRQVNLKPCKKTEWSPFPKTSGLAHCI